MFTDCCFVDYTIVKPSYLYHGYFLLVKFILILKQCRYMLNIWRVKTAMIYYPKLINNNNMCPGETLTLSQCTLAGPVDTGMPLVDPVYTGIPLCHPANTCRVHWNTTGKLNWNSPTLECHWRNSNFCSLHWNTTGETVIAHTGPYTYN